MNVFITLKGAHYFFFIFIYYISEQFPKEVSEKRKALVPKLLKARSEGKEASISYDKLYVQGKLVNDSQSEEESMQTDSHGASGGSSQV